MGLWLFKSKTSPLIIQKKTPLQNNQDDNIEGMKRFSQTQKLLIVIVSFVIALLSIPFILYYSKKPLQTNNKTSTNNSLIKDTITYWVARNISMVTDSVEKKQLEYGKELIAHTAKYFGPNGTISKISNGLNCQNCHLDAGTVVFGNNYGSVASLYPKFRARSGTVESIYKRVNDCFERSLNGKSINTMSKEMQAIVSYINFVGSKVMKGQKAAGSGFKDLAYLDRDADPSKGKIVYKYKCESCHQANGEGIYNADKTEFIYPALWGSNSFNDGAGLYRLSNMAKFVKYNMPQGTTYQYPQLSDEEAWDVAAFVETQTRPHIKVTKDWPDKSTKPVDFPFGPYADTFSEKQHKYGPFKPIELVKTKKSSRANIKMK